MWKLTAYLILLISFFYTSVTANGLHGAIERVLYYHSYLAEEFSKAGDDYTIAPGCSGHRGANRCSFDEFLQHISAKGADNEKPDVSLFDTGTNAIPGFDIYANNVETLVHKIMAYRPKSGHAITGLVDVVALFPDAKDYYDALSRGGDPISYATALLPSFDDKDPTQAKKKAQLQHHIDSGKQSSLALSELAARKMDYDPKGGQRVKYMQDKFGAGIHVSRWNNRGGKFAGIFNVLNITQSVENGIKPEDLKNAQEEWQKDTKNAKFFRTFESAKRAVRGSGCAGAL